MSIENEHQIVELSSGGSNDVGWEKFMAETRQKSFAALFLTNLGLGTGFLISGLKGKNSDLTFFGAGVVSSSLISLRLWLNATKDLKKAELKIRQIRK